MNSSERLNAAGLPLDFKSEYGRIEQFDDHSCLFAVVGMVAGCTAHEVRSVAVANGHIPEHGPYAIVDDRSLAAFLVAHYGWVASNWKECSATYLLIKLALAGVGVALAVYLVRKAASAAGDAAAAIVPLINPADANNVAYHTVSEIGGAIVTDPTGPGKNADGSWSLGGWLYDVTHPGTVSAIKGKP